MRYYYRTKTDYRKHLNEDTYQDGFENQLLISKDVHELTVLSFKFLKKIKPKKHIKKFIHPLGLVKQKINSNDSYGKACKTNGRKS